MKVRFISKVPTEAQARRLGKYYRPGTEFHIRLGRERVVFGMSFWGGQPWVHILPDPTFGYAEPGYVYPVPLCLFEILDGRVSKYWEARLTEDDDVLLWPPSFYRDYYMDHLTDERPEEVEDFARVRSLIEAEAESKPSEA